MFVLALAPELNELGAQPGALSMLPDDTAVSPAALRSDERNDQALCVAVGAFVVDSTGAHDEAMQSTLQEASDAMEAKVRMLADGLKELRDDARASATMLYNRTESCFSGHEFIHVRKMVLSLERTGAGHGRQQWCTCRDAGHGR